LDPLVIKPNIVFSNTGKIGINLTKDYHLKSSFKGSYINKALNLSTRNNFLGGLIVSKVKTVFDPLKIPSQLDRFQPIDVNVSLSNFKVSKKLIQSTLYGKKGKAGKEIPEKQDHDKGAKISLPRVNLNLSGNNIFIDKKNVSMKGFITVNKNKIKSNNLKLRYGKGSVLTKFNTTIIDTKNIKNSVNLKFLNVEVAGFNAFFPPYIKDLRGRFKGKVFGHVNLAKKLNYSLDASLYGKGGELKSFNVAKIVGPMLSDIKLLKGKVPKTYNISDRFEKLTIKAKANNKKIILKKFSLVGNRSESKATAKGTVSMIDRPSEVKGSLYIKQHARALKKYLRRTYLPFHLKGDGFALIPQAKFTTDFIMERLYKTAVGNQKRKLKAEIRKQKKKLKAELNKQKKKAKAEIRKQKKKAKAELKKKTKKFKKDSEKKLKKEAKKLFKGIKL